jgi:hypothetical protein
LALDLDLGLFGVLHRTYTIRWWMDDAAELSSNAQSTLDRRLVFRRRSNAGHRRNFLMWWGASSRHG